MVIGRIDPGVTAEQRERAAAAVAESALTDPVLVLVLVLVRAGPDDAILVYYDDPAPTHRPSRFSGLRLHRLELLQ